MIFSPFPSAIPVSHSPQGSRSITMISTSTSMEDCNSRSTHWTQLESPPKLFTVYNSFLIRQVKRHQNTPCMNSCPYLELPLNLIWNQKMPMTLTYTQSNLLCFYTTLAPQISIPKLLFKALTQKFSILPDYTPSFLQSDAFCCGADTIVDQSIGHCTVGQSLIAWYHNIDTYSVNPIMIINIQFLSLPCCNSTMIICKFYNFNFIE